MQVDKELLARLPRTFVPALNEQMRGWDLLFPAEQRSIRAQLDWLARQPGAEFDKLFEPIKQLEARMELPRWDLNAQRLSIDDTSILVRSPYYPQWRAAVEKVFEQIDAGILNGRAQALPNRLLVCTLPAGLPLGSGPLWPRLEKQGRWIGLTAPFGTMFEPLVEAVAARKPRAEAEPLERTWAFECDSRMTQMPAAAHRVALSFDALGPVRREFLKRLNAIHKDLRDMDATYDDLRRLDFKAGAPLGTPRIREFVRTLFLSGNGTMLFGNSFVEWGASEALRRVQPSALFCCFGIRSKLKPFSSVVLFEDQNRANPTPDQPDPAGSLMDIRPLAEYVYLKASRQPARTAAIFAAPELDRVLVLAPPEFVPQGSRLAGADLCAAAVEWLA
jgi:hypothetical protein